MKFTFVNGWQNPRFTVYNAANQIIYQCTIAGLNQDGLIESHEEVSIKRTDLNYTLKEYFIGYRLHFTLYYNQFINLETLLKFKNVVDYQRKSNAAGPYKIFLTPNEDNLARRFEVIFTNENIDIAAIKSSGRAFGNKAVIFKLQTVDLYKDFQITDPADIPQTYLNNFYII